MEREITQAEDAQFTHDALNAIQNLRSALGRLLAAAPGQGATPTDIQRGLDIDMTLSWKIHKVLRASSAAAAVQHVPGMPSVRTLLKAAGKRGASTDLIEATAGAAEEFNRVVSTHAGDRSTFESMVSALGTSEEAESLDLNYRRAAFRSARHIWGVSAKTRLVTRIINPCEAPDSFDIYTVQGYISMHKLRSSARLLISQARLTYDDGELVDVKTEALADNLNTQHGIAIMPEFCSQPLPEIREVAAPDGFVAGELCNSGVGQTATSTCVVGYVFREVPTRWYVPGSNEHMKGYALVRMPCEALILDTFVPAGFFAPGMPKALAFAESGDYLDYPEIEEKGHGVRLHATVEKVGKGAAAAHTPDVPRYTEMAQHLFDRAGKDGSQFDLYRCRIEYPVMPSMALMMFDLLQKPE